MDAQNYIVPKVEDGAININSRSNDFRAKILSNLVNRPFIIDGQICSSVEGFLAGILYPLDDIRRNRSFASCYAYSQKLVEEGIKLNNSKIMWNGQDYQYGSNEHKNLIARSILESILQNEDRKQALINTDGLIIKHVTGFPDFDFFTADEFCQILTSIRNRLIPHP